MNRTEFLSLLSFNINKDSPSSDALCTHVIHMHIFIYLFLVMKNHDKSQFNRFHLNEHLLLCAKGQQAADYLCLI